MNCPWCCNETPSPVVEARRSRKRGLRRHYYCAHCDRGFNVYGGATPGELARARAILRQKGYLK